MSATIEQIEISSPDRLTASPLVSVYMLAYRHEAYIAQAIEGVLGQICDFDIELIIGEDCSPDATGGIARDYQRRHPDRIRLLTANRNIGMRPNGLRCIKACRGEYIAICEGDDFWTDPLKLQRQVDLLSRHQEIVLAAHPVREMDAATGNLGATLRPVFSSRLVSMHELILGDGGLLPSPSIMYRRKLLERMPQWYYDSPVGDFPLVLVAAMHGDIAVQNRCMAVYRRNTPSSWSRNLGQDFERRWRDIRSLEATLARFNVDTVGRYSIEINQLLSKRYSDALLLDGCDQTRKLQVFGEFSSRMLALDRMFCRLALHTPWKFTGLKALIRKTRSLLRMLRGEMNMPRIR